MSDHTRALWGELRRAVEHARHEHERIARVVWLLWEYRTDTDEWIAMRDYAVRGFSGAEAGTVALDDVVVWMTAEGEQEAAWRDIVICGSPNAMWRAAWSWAILSGGAKRSPCLAHSGFHSWCRLDDDCFGWAVEAAPWNRSSLQTLEGPLGTTWPDHLDTTPIKEAARA
jgi:hypothetical protein